MSEPLDSLTQWRIAETQRMAKIPRKVDLPAVAVIPGGTLHIRPRPVVRLPTHHCAHCSKGYWPRRATQLYCGDECGTEAKHARERERRGKAPKVPFNLRAERDRAVAAVCALWPNVTPGMILGASRCAPIVRPRHAACRLTMDQRQGASISDVARAFKRDHTSIMNGLRKHAACMAEPEYAERFAKARAALGLADG